MQSYRLTVGYNYDHACDEEHFSVNVYFDAANLQDAMKHISREMKAYLVPRCNVLRVTLEKE